MELWIKRALLIILILCILSPIGILLTWNYGDAWGEWSKVNMGNKTWVPQHYSGGAPLKDYNVPGWDSEFLASLGYILSAFIGVFMVITVTLGIVKMGEIQREIRKRNVEKH